LRTVAAQVAEARDWILDPRLFQRLGHPLLSRVDQLGGIERDRIAVEQQLVRLLHRL